MKQIHKLKQLNQKLEDALKRIYSIAVDQNNKQIQLIVHEALDKKGNSK